MLFKLEQEIRMNRLAQGGMPLQQPFHVYIAQESLAFVADCTNE